MRNNYRRLVESLRPRVKQLHPSQLTSLPGHPLEDVMSNLVAAIVESMKDEGWNGSPVVTVGKEHQVLDGRHRVAAAKAIDVPVDVINIPEEVYFAMANSMPPKSLEEIAEWARGNYQDG